MPRFLLRSSSAVLFCVVLVVATVAVLRAQRARADAEFLAAANLRNISLAVGGVERRALVHLPPAYDGRSALPLVLMFHGNGGTPEASVQETGWVTKADAAGFIVAFPEATRPDMTQPAKFGRNNPAWNDGSGRFHACVRDAADVAFIAALLDHLAAQFPVDRRRVFATGFSNGASMAFRVGLELSERIAAIAPVSGALWIAEPKSTRPVSLLYLTGTADPINPMEGGAPKMASGAGFRGVPEKAKPPVRENVARWVKLIGANTKEESLASPVAGVSSVRHTGGREGTEVVFTTIANHGHIWPGAKSPLPEFIVGQATSRLDAAAVIWDFFAKHPQPETKP